MPVSAADSRPSPLVDLALLLTVTIWAVNFPLVKLLLNEFPPLGFNVIRLVGASLLLLLICFLAGETPSIRKRDWPRLVAISFFGHTCYQTLFITGVNQTTATNSAILLGLTPVFVSILGRITGIERVSRASWFGIFISVVGVTLVIGGTGKTGGSARGDLTILVSTVCWSAYTLFSRSLVERYGSLATASYSLALGSLMFLPIGLSSFWKIEWASVSAFGWSGTVVSFLGAIVIAYLLWYYALSRVGPARTAIYSNLTPVITMVVSYLWIQEAIGLSQVLGTAAVLTGIFLVRRG